MNAVLSKKKNISDMFQTSGLALPDAIPPPQRLARNLSADISFGSLLQSARHFSGG